MQHRVGGQTCPHFTLAQVLERDLTSLKRAIARASLVLVHSGEIDAGGELGLGLSTFERTLRRSAGRLEPAPRRRRAALRLHRRPRVPAPRRDHQEGGPLRAQVRSLPPPRALPGGGEAAGSDHRLALLAGLRGRGLSPLPSDHRRLRHRPAAANLRPWGKLASRSASSRSSPWTSGARPEAERSPTVSRSPPVRGSPACTVCRPRVALERGRAGWAGCSPSAARAEVEVGLRAVERGDVTVELCDVRGEAGLRGGTIRAQVGKLFEVFFRLRGAAEARVSVEVFHPDAQRSRSGRPR